MGTPRQHQIDFLLNARQNSGFSAVFSKAQQEVARLGKEIKSLEQVQKDVSAYQKQQAAVQNTEQKLRNLTSQQTFLKEEMKSASADALPGLQREYLKLDQQIKSANDALERQRQKLGDTEGKLRNAGINTADLSGKSAELAQRLRALEAEQEKAAQGARTWGETLAESAGAAQQALAAGGIALGLKRIADEMGKCAQAAIQYESAMAGVRRTVGGSAESIEALGQDFRELSTDIPATASELGKIAETAGQLGIARSAVSGFTEVMAKLSTTTDLTADTAATMLAQFANITGATDYQRLGSTVAELGDATATTASKVVELSQGLAAAANLAGMSETDILAISAAVGSLGIEAQAGSTAMSTLISTLYKAVETGKGLEDFAAVANMTAAQFKTAWGQDAVSAMDAFIQGLNDTERNGRSAIVILDELGITNVRQTKAILGLASAGDLLSGTIRQANAAWSENTALQEKANIMYNTTESRLVMMRNAGEDLRITIGEQFMPELRLLIQAGTHVLGVMNDFTREHPALVKGIISITAVAGTAAAGITAVSAAAKVLKVLDLAAVFAGPAAPAIIAATALGGLAAAVLGISAGAREGIPAVRDLTQAVQDMRGVLEDSAGACDNSAQSILAAANMADTYISRLDALDGGIHRSAQSQRDYHNILALLCETVPELADSIDLENDTIDGGTAALRANTQAWKQNAMAQAYQDRLTALYAAQADVLLEAEKNRLRLTEAQVKADQIEERRTAALQRMNELSKEAQRLGEALPQEYYDLQSSLVALGREYQRAEATVRAYEAAVAEGGETAAEAEAEIALAAEAAQNLSGTLANTSGAEAQTGALSQLQTALAPVRSQVELLEAAYQEAYTAALESVSGQYQLWQEAAQVIPTSAEAVNKALESQAAYWRDYNANLQAVLNNAGEIEGLNQMLASLDPGDKDTVNFVAGLAQASKTDKKALEEMVKNWQEAKRAQEEAAGSFSDYVTDFSGQMDNLQGTVAETVQNLNLADQAAESARETIQAYIDQAGGMTGGVRAAYARLGQAALDALSGGPGAVPAVEDTRTKRRRAYASGTSNAERGVALVGENGPELVYFHGGERVFTAAQTASMAVPAAPVMPVLPAGSPVQVVLETPEARPAEPAKAAEPLRALPLPRAESGGVQPVSVQLDIHIDSSASPETAEAFRDYIQGGDFEARILEVFQNARADAQRRAY